MQDLVPNQETLRRGITWDKRRLGMFSWFGVCREFLWAVLKEG